MSKIGVKKVKTDIDCPPGMIIRKGYNRKGYTRADGVKIKPTYVNPVCIPDRGKPGKGPKILPKPGKEIQLKKYGYSVKHSDKERHSALDRAIKVYGVNPVKRHLNLIRNLQATDSHAENIMAKDVEYLKKKFPPKSSRK